MKIELINLLRCPRTSERLVYEGPDQPSGEIESGHLVSKISGHSYPIRNGIPRFVPASNYANNFGMQWNYFRKTQLDSYSGHSISADRFWSATGWSPDDLKGSWVLDAGCGSGRFAEIALSAGAKVVALDYSDAVDACLKNLKKHSCLHVVQGDIYSLPLAPAEFKFVYSLGVLQHTPDVGKAFAALPPLLSNDGKLCADFYWNRLQTILHPKYLVRPITKRMPQDLLFSTLKKIVPTLLIMSRIAGKSPVGAKVLQRLIPVANYEGRYPLNEQQLVEWALLDTFDMLAPAYDKPQSVKTVKKLFQNSQLVDTEIEHVGHLVGRGRAPAQKTAS